MFRRRGFRQSKAADDPGVFNPDDATQVRHTKIGVWDLYEQIEPKARFVPSSLLPTLESYNSMRGSMPYVWQMLKEIASIPSCLWLLTCYLLITFILAFIPAIELWYSGLLLEIVQNAVEHRTIDHNVLFKVALSRLSCSMATRFLNYTASRFNRPLNERIKQYYSVQSFAARARLDVPTYSDSSILRQLDNSQPSARTSLAWNSVEEILLISSTTIELISQFSVLITMLRKQRDGILLASLSFAQVLFQRQMRNTMGAWGGPPGVWAATTRNEDYLRAMGVAKLVHQQHHRQEIVAGGLADSLISIYRAISQRLGEDATNFSDAFRLLRLHKGMSWAQFLSDPLEELPRIIFTLRAVQYPTDIPLSLASLNLITQTTNRFSRTLFDLLRETGSIAQHLANIRKLYETFNIPNIVEDGPKPFPEDQRSLENGISVEFRQVCFRYPGGTRDVLRNVSFKIRQGQLCVIVGANGSGKSTILKLISRLYDPASGEILLNGQDIRTFRLADLRKATSVLFQDYTHFPLSIKDNIALGDPAAFAELSTPGPKTDHLKSRIHEAAQLGGADGFIEKMDEKYDTFLERPIEDLYSTLPSGTKTLFGRSVEYRGLRSAGNMNTHAMGLSGGQMQRIALSRTFMRDDGVGLLCFDEPSASLDPTAEHDLFERLRRLRGNKTMIFSSHRFGNLTRHADLILYMDDASILEEGTHDELIKRDGGYAKIWMLQAQAFL
ncbi:ABC transporter related protein [Mycena indigotica]|uniref:ABC transporter related protein n=1 Tax=Mycena indigotica TaxID=2126181 RepID=A0A8H6SUB6_9AGAR|nr:ABC transporter related protein [Mycena indigotica]KAF7306320.1 ABC transporter related protein [Mycena indigotica]